MFNIKIKKKKNLFQMDESKADNRYMYKGEFITVNVPSFEKSGVNGLEFSIIENSTEYPSINLPFVQISQTLKPPKVDQKELNLKKSIKSMEEQKISNQELAHMISNTIKRLEINSMTSRNGDGFPIHEPTLFAYLEEEQQNETSD